MKYILTEDGVKTSIELKTKREVRDWCDSQIEIRGLDWRVGYLIRFRDSSIQYEWKTDKGDRIK